MQHSRQCCSGKPTFPIADRRCSLSRNLQELVTAPKCPTGLELLKMLGRSHELGEFFLSQDIFVCFFFFCSWTFCVFVFFVCVFCGVLFCFLFFVFFFCLFVVVFFLLFFFFFWGGGLK